jgi:hypothetical protein
VLSLDWKWRKCLRRGKDRALSGYIKRFKLSDKGANLERLGRHLQMSTLIRLGWIYPYFHA